MTDTAQVRQRLATARGHMDAVIRMVNEDRYCIDVLHQISAVQGALTTVRRALLEHHLRECVPQAVAEGRIEALVDELLAATFGGQPLKARFPHESRTMSQGVTM